MQSQGVTHGYSSDSSIYQSGPTLWIVQHVLHAAIVCKTLSLDPPSIFHLFPKNKNHNHKYTRADSLASGR